MKKSISVAAVFVIMVFLLHTTPQMALRTQVFLMGYPKAALTSGIMEDEYHNKVDKQKFEELNAKAYTLTKPPVEKATQGQLRNFLVKKYGFLHFAEYYGEG